MKPKTKRPTRKAPAKPRAPKANANQTQPSPPATIEDAIQAGHEHIPVGDPVRHSSPEEIEAFRNRNAPLNPPDLGQSSPPQSELVASEIVQNASKNGAPEDQRVMEFHDPGRVLKCGCVDDGDVIRKCDQHGGGMTPPLKPHFPWWPDGPSELVWPQYTSEEKSHFTSIANKTRPLSIDTDPSAPPKTPEAGDKTPEFFEWAMRTYPEEAAVRYRVFIAYREAKGI